MYQLNIQLSSVYFYLAIVLIVILGCNKTASIAPVEEEDKSLVFQTFFLEKKKNPDLGADVVFDIQDNTITGQLNHHNFKVIPTFTTNAQSVEINEVKQLSGTSLVDFRENIVYTLKSASGTSKRYSIKIDWDDNLPHFYISTDGGVPVISKRQYVPATITLEGQLKYEGYTGTAQIRGRGNTTWTYPKKPFKFKLDEDASILGLKEEKDWILLANYLDRTHLLNAVGMKIGQLLQMPYTNTVIPVEVTLNGTYLGAYMLTEQIEVKPNRVNVGEDGILLNLDTNFDELWQFLSNSYKLPVTVKYPKQMNSSKLAAIKQEFEELEKLVVDASFPNNKYLDLLDAQSIANYLITYMFTGNEEINHPKSTYLHKTSSGKFAMGPIWDFDWAFAYEGSLEHFVKFDRPLFWSNSAKGTQFFSKFLSDPEIKSLIKKNWADFHDNHLPELFSYIDEYAFIIKGAKSRDFEKWRQGNNNQFEELAKLKSWLRFRASYMNNYVNQL